MFLLMNWCTRIVILVESFANNKILLFTSKMANGATNLDRNY